MPSGLTLVHLHPVSVVEMGGMSMLSALVRDRLSPTRKEKLWCCLSISPSRAGRDTSGRKRVLVTFFTFFQMGANNSNLTPLNYILKNWDRFDPQGLKKTHLIFLCDTTWPQYPLEDGKWWPVGGSLKYNNFYN